MTEPCPSADRSGMMRDGVKGQGTGARALPSKPCRECRRSVLFPATKEQTDDDAGNADRLARIHGEKSGPRTVQAAMKHGSAPAVFPVG